MKLAASLSLDLDNEWSYLRTHGDAAWKDLPSYLEIFIPRLLEFLARHSLQITVFVVGLDAAQKGNRPLLEGLTAAGHEIGSHSYHHEPWLHLYSPSELDSELELAEEAIAAATGARPIGFRGPGYSLSKVTLEALARRGYRYDASTLPTFLGPLARTYYFRSTKLSPEQRKRRSALFGEFRDGLRPIRPFLWRLGDRTLLEVPVTTMPVLRTPIHFSYLLYLSTISFPLSRAYFRTALGLCRATGIQPSLLLHPLDFLGCDDTSALSFFPAMRQSSSWKLTRVRHFLQTLTELFDVMPIARQVDALERENRLSEREPHIGARRGVDSRPDH